MYQAAVFADPFNEEDNAARTMRPECVHKFTVEALLVALCGPAALGEVRRCLEVTPPSCLSRLQDHTLVTGCVQNVRRGLCYLAAIDMYAMARDP